MQMATSSPLSWPCIDLEGMGIDQDLMKEEEEELEKKLEKEKEERKKEEKKKDGDQDDNSFSP